jgi:hypothetical protein
LGVSPHVPQEFQPLDNAVVEINQFSFGKPVNVDPHDYSRSHRKAAAVNIQKLLGNRHALTKVCGHAGTHPFCYSKPDGTNREARKIVRMRITSPTR